MVITSLYYANVYLSIRLGGTFTQYVLSMRKKDSVLIVITILSALRVNMDSRGFLKMGS